MAEPTTQGGAQPTPQQAVVLARVIWGALVAGQVAFAVMVLVGLPETAELGDPSLYPELLYVSVAMLVVLTAAGYFGRMQVYKANWQGHAVTPRGYLMGNLLLFILLETVSIAALVAVVVTQKVMPTVVVAALSLLIQLVNFPVPGPMAPTRPEFVEGPGESRRS